MLATYFYVEQTISLPIYKIRVVCAQTVVNFRSLSRCTFYKKLIFL
nr:MAG TPA: hypothetical protein [Caudoviricetes sp.]